MINSASRIVWLTRIEQPNGVEKIHPIGPLSAEEEKLMEACLPDLKTNIEKGKAFVAQS